MLVEYHFMSCTFNWTSAVAKPFKSAGSSLGLTSSIAGPIAVEVA